MVNEDAIGYAPNPNLLSSIPYREASESESLISSDTGSAFARLTASPGYSLPFGINARRLLVYFTTQLTYRKKLDADDRNIVPMPASKNQLFTALGLPTVGYGKRGQGAQVMQQLERLYNTSITITNTIAWDEFKNGHRITSDIGRKIHLWQKHPDDHPLDEQSYITVSNEFRDLVTANPVPIRLDDVAQLKRPRAFDLYIWACSRKYWLSRSREETCYLSWEAAAKQFSDRKKHTNRQLADFRKDARLALDDVNELWPECGAYTDRKGIHIPTGPPRVEAFLDNGISKSLVSELGNAAGQGKSTTEVESPRSAVDPRVAGSNGREASFEGRLDYLSTQVERLIDLQRSEGTPLTPFRKAAMLTGQSFEQEVLAMKVLESVFHFNDSQTAELFGGSVVVPDKTKLLFEEYSRDGIVTVDETLDLLTTIISGGRAAASQLLRGWSQTH